MSQPAADSIEVTVREIAHRAASAVGVGVYDVVFVQNGPRWVLTVYLDRPEGVDLADCQAVSEQLGAELEVDDPIPHAYTLEVSSPGLDRPLRTPEHWKRAEGERVRFALAEPRQRRRRFRGRVLAAATTTVTVDVDDVGKQVFELGEMAKARVEPEF